MGSLCSMVSEKTCFEIYDIGMKNDVKLLEVCITYYQFLIYNKDAYFVLLYSMWHPKPGAEKGSCPLPMEGFANNVYWSTLFTFDMGYFDSQVTKRGCCCSSPWIYPLDLPVKSMYIYHKFFIYRLSTPLIIINKVW